MAEATKRAQGKRFFEEVFAECKSGDVEWDYPKLRRCVQNIVRDTSKGHIVFCEYLAIHAMLKWGLIESGIPENQIGILNGAITPKVGDRQAVAERFSPPVVAPDDPCYVPPAKDRLIVVIANSVAYEGLNLQVNTGYVHHLDLSWEPSTIQQRNGRAVRQLNTLPFVEIHYYLAARSSDLARYLMIKAKKAWIDAVFEGAESVNNPAASQDAGSALRQEMELSRDPEVTQKLFLAFQEANVEKIRQQAGRNAAKQLAIIQLTKAAHPARAKGAFSVLRGIQERTPDAYPWEHLDRVFHTPMYVPQNGGIPLSTGMRVGLSALDGFEVGAVGPRWVWARRANSDIWELLSANWLDSVESLRNPSCFPAAWEDDEARVLAGIEATVVGDSGAGAWGVSGSAKTAWPQAHYQHASPSWLRAWQGRIKEAVINAPLRLDFNPFEVTKKGLVRATKVRVPYTGTNGLLAFARSVSDFYFDSTTVEYKREYWRLPEDAKPVIGPDALFDLTLDGFKRYLDAVKDNPAVKGDDVQSCARFWWGRGAPAGAKDIGALAFVESEGVALKVVADYQAPTVSAKIAKAVSAEGALSVENVHFNGEATDFAGYRYGKFFAFQADTSLQVRGTKTKWGYSESGAWGRQTKATVERLFDGNKVFVLDTTTQSTPSGVVRAFERLGDAKAYAWALASGAPPGDTFEYAVAVAARARGL